MPATWPRNFFGHRDKNGKGFPGRVRAHGYPLRWPPKTSPPGKKTAGSGGTGLAEKPRPPQQRHELQFRETGIAMVYQPDDKPLKGQSMGLRYYWVQVFGVQR